MPVIEPMLMEMEQEAVATRRLLERVPDASLGWKPHPKSRTLGELAVHIAQTQKQVSSMIQGSSHEVMMEKEEVPEDAGAILALFEEGLASAKAMLVSSRRTCASSACRCHRSTARPPTRTRSAERRSAACRGAPAPSPALLFSPPLSPLETRNW
jgi:DNA topoisomerase VI subunit B